MFKAKYIIVDTGSFYLPVIFSDTETHLRMAMHIISARALDDGAVLGAGFIRIENNKFVCFGESLSLRVKSRDQTDSDYLNKYLGVTQDLI